MNEAGVKQTVCTEGDVDSLGTLGPREHIPFDSLRNLGRPLLVRGMVTGIIHGPGSLWDDISRKLARYGDAMKRGTPPPTILVVGETGAGKEGIARALHLVSGEGKGQEPFVGLNCGAMPENLIESELFGYERGAFTGANRRHKGAFEQALGGTLFLDEIGEMPLAAQVKLLRALDAREIRHVGGTALIDVGDVRIVCATNADLEELVAAGKFREDLYYRISALDMSLPPLRERPGDMLPLIGHFLDEMRVLRGGGDPTDESTVPDGIHVSVLEVLLAYKWPGNVRELQNAIRSAFVNCEGKTITLRDLPRKIVGVPLRVPDPAVAAALEMEAMSAASPSGDLEDKRREFRRQVMSVCMVDYEPGTKPRDVARQVQKMLCEVALEITGGNKSVAAQIMNIDRSNFTRLLGSQ